MVKRSTNRESKVTLKIPRPLYEKLLAMIDGRGYNSATDFVVYVLRDLLATHELALREGEDAYVRAGGVQNQLEKVKARLKALGDLASDSARWDRREDT